MLGRYSPSVDAGGLPLLLSGRCRGEMGEGDESNRVWGVMEESLIPALCVTGGGPERAGDVPEVTQHIRGTASTRIQVSRAVGSTLGLGTYWRTLACPFP